MTDGTPVPEMACTMNPGRKYAGVPIGIRTGTTAGYTAHHRASEEPCDACKRANAAKTAVRRGHDADGYAAYRRALDEYGYRVAAGEDVPVCAKPTPEYPAGRTGSSAGYSAHYYAGETACEPCLKGNAAEQAQRRIDDPDEMLRGNLYAHYRLSLERYKEMLAEQGNKCAICGTESPEDIRLNRFHVDHDRSCCPRFGSCGKCVRGLLCRACNTALGNFRDNPDVLASALSYLLSYGKAVAGRK